MGRDGKSHELCQPSIDILRDQCIAWFARKGVPGPIHFPDRDELLFGEETREVVNVVFFGSFLKRLLESANWTALRYRFWVPSEASRDVLTQLIGVPAAQVVTIPRYELYPRRGKQRNFPKPGEAFTLVFSGRLSPNKDIELLVKTVSFLQTEQRLPVKLALVGNFDNEFHVDRDPPPAWERMDYPERIAKTIRELKWVSPPRLIHDRGSQNWYREKFENPVFASLSTFICEDFGVSLAQAQALGWPCLLSDWGGHRDVRGPGVHRIPSSMIGTYMSGEHATLRARQLALTIRGLIENPPPRRADAKSRPDLKKERTRLPAILTVTDLDAIRRDLVDKLGRGAHLISRGEFPSVNNTPAGAIFLSKYRQLFSGPTPDACNVVLANNFNRSADLRLKYVAKACRWIAEQSVARGIPLVYSSAQEVFHMDTLSLLLRAKSVILPFFIEEMLPLGLFLQRALRSEAPLTVLAVVPATEEGRKMRAALRALRATSHAMSRSSDRIVEFANDAEMGRWVRRDLYAAEPLIRRHGTFSLTDVPRRAIFIDKTYKSESLR